MSYTSKYNLYENLDMWCCNNVDYNVGYGCKGCVLRSICHEMNNAGNIPEKFELFKADMVLQASVRKKLKAHGCYEEFAPLFRPGVKFK